jgi:hypothetical protein
MGRVARRGRLRRAHGRRIRDASMGEGTLGDTRGFSLVNAAYAALAA